MAKAISVIGLEDTGNSPSVIGVSEVENRMVLEDLVNDSLLLKKDYGIIHFNSPDSRGIDVALLYQKALFVPQNMTTHKLLLFDKKTSKRIYTRDQLLVSGLLDGELLYFIINHWPSRRSGEQRSRHKRMAAARLTKRIVDSLQSSDPYAKIICMGDFNDNPNNSSFKQVLNTYKLRSKVPLKGLFNPMEQMFRKGLGSNAYRDSWSLFDQILITQPFLKKEYSSYRFYKAGIFNKSFLVTNKGKYKGYPFRSFTNNNFTGGYSDHFPVYLYLIKAL